MALTNETRLILERYIRNADPFLWNTTQATNKKGRIAELQTYGYLKKFTKGNPTYRMLNDDLLVEPGVEGILKEIVAKRITNTFDPEILAYLRRSWETATIPTMDYLKQNGIYHKHYLTDSETREGPGPRPPSGYKEQACIFFEIDSAYDYIVRWTTFAGLWFEFIEPLLYQSGSDQGKIDMAEILAALGKIKPK